MAVSDPAITGWMANHHNLHMIAPALGALLVVATGKWLMIRDAAQQAARRGRRRPDRWLSRQTRSQHEKSLDSGGRRRSGAHRAAVAEAIRIYSKEPVTVHLLSVQPAVSGHVAMFFGSGELHQLQ